MTTVHTIMTIINTTTSIVNKTIMITVNNNIISSTAMTAPHSQLVHAKGT